MTRAPMYLEIDHPDADPCGFFVGDAVVVVGRSSSDADVHLQWDQGVSSVHARLWQDPDGLWIEDTQSTNGILVDGEEMQTPCVIPEGKTVTLGNTVLTPRATSLAMPAIGDKVEWLHGMPPQRLSLPAEDDGSASVTIDLRELAGMLAAIDDDDDEDEAVVEENADLEEMAAAGVDEAVEEAVAQRSAPRFASATRVVLEAADREELRVLWTSDISKGGLFVVTEQPPGLDSSLTVHIQTPDGSVDLSARVVHVVDPETARNLNYTAGVGLQFVDLRAEKRHAISRYVEGVAQNLKFMQVSRAPGPKAESSSDNPERALELVRLASKLIDAADEQNYYVALELKPSATRSEIVGKLKRVRAEFEDQSSVKNLGQRRRIRSAVELLARMGAELGEDERRLAYDFKNGLVNANARLKSGKIGVETLRQVWREVNPREASRASHLAVKAFHSRQSGDLEGAIKSGETVLKLDPFHMDIRSNLEIWKDLKAKAGQPAAEPTPAPRSRKKPKKKKKEKKKGFFKWAA